jgi:hypothetical protein
VSGVTIAQLSISGKQVAKEKTSKYTLRCALFAFTDKMVKMAAYRRRTQPGS